MECDVENRGREAVPLRLRVFTSDTGFKFSLVTPDICDTDKKVGKGFGGGISSLKLLSKTALDTRRVKL